MVFRRRTRRNLAEILVRLFYPRGGWRRAVSYVGHRISRLPDRPERIAKGVACGVMASFTPLFGLHFVISFLLARAVGGNVLAAILGTFFGNPLTFPIIVEVSMQVGTFLLGRDEILHVPQVMAAMGRAWGDLWQNLAAVMQGNPTDWSLPLAFMDRVFLPYLVGCILPGIIVSLCIYVLTLPVIRAYQTSRQRRLRARFEHSRQLLVERAARGELPAPPPALPATLPARLSADLAAGLSAGSLTLDAADAAATRDETPPAAQDAATDPEPKDDGPERIAAPNSGQSGDNASRNPRGNG